MCRRKAGVCRLSSPARGFMSAGSECVRGQSHKTLRPQERAVRRAGQSASSASLRFPGRCGVSPHEGGAGDSVAAPTWGRTFPTKRFFFYDRIALSRGRLVDAMHWRASDADWCRTAKAMNFLRKLERAKGFEPSTPTLARLCSTPELRPLERPKPAAIVATGRGEAGG